MFFICTASAGRRGKNPACVRAKPCFLTGKFFFIPSAAARRWEWEIPQVFFCHAHRRDAAMGVTGENAALRRFAVFTQATLNHLCPAPLCGAGHEEREIPAGLLRLRVSRFAIDRILSKRSLSIWNVKGVLFVGISFPLFFQSPFHALYRLCRAGDKNKNARQIRFCRAIRFLNLPALPVIALKKRKAPHVFRALTLAAHPSKRQTETAVCISTRLATAQ